MLHVIQHVAGVRADFSPQLTQRKARQLKPLPSLCLAWQAAAVELTWMIKQSLQDEALTAAVRNKVTVLQTVFSMVCL